LRPRYNKNHHTPTKKHQPSGVKAGPRKKLHLYHGGTRPHALGRCVKKTETKNCVLPGGGFGQRRERTRNFMRRVTRNTQEIGEKKTERAGAK